MKNLGILIFTLSIFVSSASLAICTDVTLIRLYNDIKTFNGDYFQGQMEKIGLDYYCSDDEHKAILNSINALLKANKNPDPRTGRPTAAAPAAPAAAITQPAPEEKREPKSCSVSFGGQNFSGAAPDKTDCAKQVVSFIRRFCSGRAETFRTIYSYNDSSGVLDTDEATLTCAVDAASLPGPCRLNGVGAGVKNGASYSNTDEGAKACIQEIANANKEALKHGERTPYNLPQEMIKGPCKRKVTFTGEEDASEIVLGTYPVTITVNIGGTAQGKHTINAPNFPCSVKDTGGIKAQPASNTGSDH